MNKINHNNFSFTIFIVAYYKVHFVKDAVESVLNQKYDNYELIIVDNGSIEDVPEYLNNLKNNPKIRIIKYNENQFTWDDPLKQIPICWNKVLSIANGDYIMHLGYDDKISNNILIEYNEILKYKECLTLSPNIKQIDKHSNEINEIKLTNERPKILDGKKLSLSFLDEHSDIKYCYPGEIFTIKTDFLKRYGGYNRFVEMDHLFGIVPFGLTGFAKNAYVYWRRHGENLGNVLATKGISAYVYNKKWINKKNIYNLWKNQFSHNEAKYIVRSLSLRSVKLDCLNIAENIYTLEFVGALKIIKHVSKHYFFYVYILIAFYHRKYSLLKLFK